MNIENNHLLFLDNKESAVITRTDGDLLWLSLVKIFLVKSTMQ